MNCSMERFCTVLFHFSSETVRTFPTTAQFFGNIACLAGVFTHTYTYRCTHTGANPLPVLRVINYPGWQQDEFPLRYFQLSLPQYIRLRLKRQGTELQKIN